ncbi:MAG: ATP-binding protein [Candidatus Hydrogenedentes bacterium]|jgi:anti-sigma regulatory factor (Ser/Thr protein kinase)|nr:ATP-binding protein [Candidatus Hydrogenedentota bacterium]
MKEPGITMEVSADPALLGAVRGAVSCYLDANGFSQERTSEVVLAVDEACANAIRHAYRGQKDRTFRLAMRATKRWLELEVRDGGKPAPQDKIVRKGLPEISDEKETMPGGLGIQLMYEVFDKVVFCPGKTRGNCVTLRLKRPA